ncbi:MAG: hypothetical protein J6V15_06955 [Clostridia bacterium]|nr:hypothetical protein [Clostridia bacterium]
MAVADGVFFLRKWRLLRRILHNAPIAVQIVLSMGALLVSTQNPSIFPTQIELFDCCLRLRGNQRPQAAAYPLYPLHPAEFAFCTKISL